MKSGKHALMRSAADIRERCVVDQVTHCWQWTGGMSCDHTPRVYAFDHARCEKRSMSGPLGAWNIAFGAAPRPGHFVARSCGNKLCLNPVHLREFASQAEIGRQIRLSGRRKATNMDARRANQRLAARAAGNDPTPPEIVRAIRAAPATVTARELALLHGIAHQTASRIRRGDSHRDVR